MIPDHRHTVVGSEDEAGLIIAKVVREQFLSLLYDVINHLDVLHIFLYVREY